MSQDLELFIQHQVSRSLLLVTLPGHGVEDYKVCKENGITEILSPGNTFLHQEHNGSVDEEGKFTALAGELFVGKPIIGEGNQAVVSHLEKLGNLLYSHSFQHKYPYDWRTKQPIIIRYNS